MRKWMAVSLTLILSVCMLVTVSAQEELMSKYDPAVEVSFARTIDDDLQENVLPATPGEDLEKNRWLDLYRDQLGINVVYDWIVKSGDAYTQKSNLVIASGDLPDVMRVTVAQLAQLAESDLIQDLTALWEQYASDDVKAYYTTYGDIVMNSVTFDGKIMGIPEAPGAYGDGYFIWIRQDWLDNLGLKGPTNMTELLQIIEAFTTQDPDQNGKDDTFGLALTKGLYSGFADSQSFMAAFKAFPNMWIEDSEGKLVFGSTLPEVKNALEVLAGLYASGQIDPEFGVKDGSKVAETIQSNKVGVVYGVQWNPIYPFLPNYLSDPDHVNWVGYALVSDTGEIYCPQNFTATNVYVVSSECENPEAVIKMINLYMDTNWGENNQFERYYMPVENNSTSVWKFSPVSPERPFKNLEAFKQLQNARASNTMAELSGEAAAIQKNLEAFDKGDKSFWGWYKIYGAEGVFNNSLEYEKNGSFFYEKFAGAPTPTMIERRSSLRDLELEYFIKIIMGSSDISAFDEFVTNWYALGGQAMTDEVNAWYSSVK